MKPTTKTQEKYITALKEGKILVYIGDVIDDLKKQAEELFTQEDLQRIVDQHIQAQKEKFKEVLIKLKDELFNMCTLDYLNKKDWYTLNKIIEEALNNQSPQSDTRLINSDNVPSNDKIEDKTPETSKLSEDAPSITSEKEDRGSNFKEVLK